ncbi:SDR family NAD(P)-dependent oxidoreductase [Undibacterium parvum]|uniref:SDR family NAD(P)-dependent oxidoreductase n=2 Tax=Undibacterium TaxID=401469 RepID=A0A6M4A4B3_9BURK|nr:SDR family NAD(P)-dependent oxidoreductase [Undibacterium parvum]AZP11737.1 SDR family NAD(P)-dependent oxidoreductase [Undibacterium parvum]QJQ06176.1 SDR family NAD(P)-dependent oxidoreductase [Undibacterium piscinae]
MKYRDKIVIVGATSAIAENCARLWIQDRSVDMILVGRDATRIERVAADLKVRSPQSEIQILQAEFLDETAIQATVDGIVAQGRVDIVLIAHGSLPEQTQCQDDLQACREALEVNGLSPVLYAEAFAKHMAKADHGTIALIGSVAGDRGRKSNYVYGAAKGLVTRYAQGLQHRFASTGVKVVLIKPGPTDTPMTAHLKGQGVKLASVEDVARKIVVAIERGQSVAYVPSKWKFIMFVIAHIPSFIFNKIDI